MDERLPFEPSDFELLDALSRQKKFTDGALRGDGVRQRTIHVWSGISKRPSGHQYDIEVLYRVRTGSLIGFFHEIVDRNTALDWFTESWAEAARRVNSKKVRI